MITNKETVKDALGLDDSKDTAIETWILLVEEWIRDYCGLREDEETPKAYELNAIKMIQYNIEQKAGVSSYSVARLSYSFQTDYPQSILKGLRRRLRWR
jgi:hypothetical protein